MANHKFHGEWSYFDFDGGSIPPRRPPSQDGTMYLLIPDNGGNGHIQPGSQHRRPSHQPNDVEGDATPTHIRITEHFGLFDIVYEGDLLEPQHGSRMVIVGTLKVIFFADSPLRSKISRTFTDDGQNDGTWVMTKP